jgi:death-on-curing protein
VTNFDDVLFLSVDDVLELHSDQLRLFGGSAGLRDGNALESAVATAATTYEGALLHDDLFHMAAAYAFHLAENQPFLDGNKRTALNAALVFLDINGWPISDPDERLYEAMISISARKLDKRGLADLFRQLATPDPG